MALMLCAEKVAQCKTRELIGAPLESLVVQGMRARLYFARLFVAYRKHEVIRNIYYVNSRRNVDSASANTIN